MLKKNISTYSSIAETVAEIGRRMNGSTGLVFVSGNFNILHPGHLRLLQFAKECGDFLAVGVCTNRIAAEGAVLDEAHRLEAVKGNSLVDFAFLLDCPPHEFVAVLEPDAVIKGKEYENRFNPEAEVVSSYGGKLLFGSGDTVFSAANLLRQELLFEERKEFVLPYDFPERQGFSFDSVRQLLTKAKHARLCVIGDVIVDEYIACEPLGMSQEDPTIVVTPVNTQSFLGGAGIVAAHCAGLGAHVDFFSVTGVDLQSNYVDEKLNEYAVHAHLIRDETRPTTLKQRFRASGKTLLRVSHLRQHGIQKELQSVLLERLLPVLDEADVVVFSDFNYGCLPQSLVDIITAEARARDVVIIADSQCSSQFGDVSRFKDADVLTPTELEARVSTRNHEDGLVVLAERIRQQSRAKNVLLKLGAEGLLIHAARPHLDDWLTDQLPVFNHYPKDIAGAGDSLLAAVAMALAIGADIWQAAFVGSLAAACQVSRIGNTPITSAELLQALR